MPPRPRVGVPDRPPATAAQCSRIQHDGSRQGRRRDRSVRRWGPGAFQETRDCHILSDGLPGIGRHNRREVPVLSIPTKQLRVWGWQLWQLWTEVERGGHRIEGVPVPTPDWRWRLIVTEGEATCAGATLGRVRVPRPGRPDDQRQAGSAYASLSGSSSQSLTTASDTRQAAGRPRAGACGWPLEPMPRGVGPSGLLAGALAGLGD